MELGAATETEGLSGGEKPRGLLPPTPMPRGEKGNFRARARTFPRAAVRGVIRRSQKTNAPVRAHEMRAAVGSNQEAPSCLDVLIVGGRVLWFRFVTRCRLGSFEVLNRRQLPVCIETRLQFSCCNDFNSEKRVKSCVFIIILCRSILYNIGMKFS